jgi:hypothetical protein
MKRQSIGTRTLIIGVLTLVAMVCFFPGTSRADSITVTVGETEYDVTTVTGTFGDNMSLLESTPWWGNSTLAQALATAVADDIGTPNEFNYGAAGPLFAYDDDAIDAFVWFQGNTSSVAVSESVSLSWGVVTPFSTGNVPEAGSFGMLFAGLFGVGLLAGMKRSRRNVLALDSE